MQPSSQSGAAGPTPSRLVRRRRPHDLFQGRHPLFQLGDRRHAEALHALADGLALELQGGGAVQDELLTSSVKDMISYTAMRPR